MADYRLTATDQSVIRTSDQAYIPNDSTNRDWALYQNWLAAGGVPDPYVAPPTPTLDQIYDQTIVTQQVLKAVVLTLNDGTLPIATNKTPAQLKAIVKSRM